MFIDSYLTSNFYLLILIVLSALGFFAWLFVKLAFLLVCLKYKCNITFKFNRFHQLANIRIIKKADTSSNQTTTDPNEFVEIFVDKLWFSSCYFNRSIKNRLMVCLSGLRINYFHQPSQQQPTTTNQSGSSDSSNIYFRFLMWLIYLFFKYFGSIYIEQVNLKLFNLFVSSGSLETSQSNQQQQHHHLKSRAKTMGSISVSERAAAKDHVNLNFDLFRIEFNQIFATQLNNNNSDESGFEAAKHEHDAELTGFRTLQCDWNNFHLKYLKQLTAQSQHQSLFDVLVSESRFRLILDKSFNRNQYKTSKNRLETFVDQVWAAQCHLSDTKCLINKFNSTKSYFTDLNYIVDHLNSHLRSNNLSSNNDVKRICLKAIRKVQLLEITDLEATCVVYKTDMLPSRSTSMSQLPIQAKQDKIKLDSMRLFVNRNRFATAAANPHKSDESKLVFLMLRNLLYSKANRFHYSLLNRLTLSLTRLDSRVNRFDCCCDNVNLYLHLKLLNDLIDSSLCNDLVKRMLIGSESKGSSGIVLDLKLKSSYIHLIELDSNQTTTKSSSSSTIVYSIGSKFLGLRSSKISQSRSFHLNLVQSIVFKSTKSIANAASNKSFNTYEKFTNYLFEENLQEWNLNKLFDSISSSSLKSSNSNCHRHYWGLLFNLNMLDFTYESSSSSSSQQQQKQSIQFILDSIYVEYSASFFRIIDNLIANNSALIDKLISAINLPTLDLEDEQQTNKSIMDIRFNIQSLHAYLFFERQIFFYLKLNKINYRSIDNSTAGFCLLIHELNLLQMKIDDDLNDKHQRQHRQFDESLEMQESLSYFLIYDYLESTNTNYNLVLLVKSFNLNSHDEQSWLLTIQDVMGTWSFQMHYILFDSIIRPVTHLIQSIEESLHFLLPQNCEQPKPPAFDIKILFESDVLVNFLFDYSQDSSKLVPQSALPLNDQQPPYIQTVSIILIDVYCRLASSMSDFELTIGDISMYVNVDDQSILSSNTDLLDCSCELSDDDSHSQRQFMHATSLAWTYGHLAIDERLDLDAKSNNLASLSFDLFHVNFIFKYDFAKLIDHILNLRKCFLKLSEQLYSNKICERKKSLSCDIQLRIDLFKLTIEDDPFEVKLAYNYALMVDEYLESVKRRETLEQRKLIKEQKLEHEAMALLREHESKIYQQRSKQIYKRKKSSKSPQNQVRTELFTICVERVKFLALADLKWHERHQCYAVLREIDAHSPPPPVEQQKNPADCYSILWCRHVNLGAEAWKFQFRDYTQPLVIMKELSLFGRVCGAEYQPASRSRRDVHISLDNATTFTIQRSMSPFKFYHDLCCRMSFFSFAYGPNMEGSMAQLNLSLDKIIHPPRDPSRPMPWWDKSRLYLHGRLTASFDQCQIIYHVSMDPYNRTEEMKLVWFNLLYDWTNMHMLFKGPLDVYLNTESKYDDCRLLHLPHLELNIDIDWLCKAQQQSAHTKLFNTQLYNPANAHNYLFPCAPDKIPTIINSCEHDSYAQFRSENVNLTVSLVCNSDGMGDGDDLPMCKFYASTSRFLQKIKNLLSAITRPTRRGRLFRNLKPRKPILSRHFKVVNFHLDIPCLNIHYWSSASEEYGVQLECDHFRLNSTHSLELVPFVDQLKRRPRPCWSIDLMKFSLAETTIYLMSPQQSKQASSSISSKIQSNEEQQETRFLDRQPAIRNFFFKIDSIFYEREKAGEKMVEFKENPKRLKKNHSVMVAAPKWPASSSLIRSMSMNNNGGGGSSDRYPIESTQLIRAQKKQHRYEKSKQQKSENVYGSILENESSAERAAEPIDFRMLNESISSSSTFLKLRHHTNPRESMIESMIRKSQERYDDKQHQQQQQQQENKKESDEKRKHNIKIVNLKAKWNNVNRDVIFALYEIYNKAKRLRHNLSSQALKNYDSMINDQLMSNLSQSYLSRQSSSNNRKFQSFKSTSSSSNQEDPAQQSTSSPLGPKSNTLLNSNNFFEDLLNKLDAERDSVVYCDDEKKRVESNNFNDMLYGVHSATKQADILEQNIYIELINSQIKLSLNDFSTSLQQQQLKSDNASSPSKQKSSMTDDAKDEEYLIISAAKANMIQRLHKPVWKSQRLLDKISWTGNLDSMQYFATLKLNEAKANSNSDDSSTKILNDLILDEDDEYWLSDRLIDNSCVLKNSSSNSCHKRKCDDEPDISSISSASTDFVSNRNRLGMLISYGVKTTTSCRLNENQNSMNVIAASKESGGKKRKNLGLMLLRRAPAANQATRSSPTLFEQKSSSSQLFNQQVYLQLVVSKCRCEFYIIDYDDRIPDENENNVNVVQSQAQLFQQQQQQHIQQSKKIANANQVDLNASFNEPVDCFTLIHHDMNLCCNSQQYKMIMDIVNNLVLYFRPRRKQVLDQQRSIKFNLQLSMGNLDSLKQHIQLKQAETKETLCKLRMLERKLFHSKEKIENEITLFNEKNGENSYKSYEFKRPEVDAPNGLSVIHELKTDNVKIELEYNECKKMLNEQSNELNVLISCYKELMLEKRAFSFSSSSAANQQFNLLFDATSPTLNNYYFASFYGHNLIRRTKMPADQQSAASSKENRKIDLNQQAQESIMNSEIGRRYEIWFKHINWKLNDDDGQTGCARFLMNNFVYTKVTNQLELDSVEHNLEVESCKIQDLTTPVADKRGAKSNNNNKMKSSGDNYVITSLFDTLLHQAESNRSDDESQLNSLDPATNQQMMFRIFCKERPPVGIPVIEHLELNLSPLVIKLTNRFYKMMIKFFFEQQQQQQQQVRVKSSTLNQRHMYRKSTTVNEEHLVQLNVSVLATPASSSMSPNSTMPTPKCDRSVVANSSAILQSPIVAGKATMLQKKASQSSLFNNSVLLNTNNTTSTSQINAAASTSVVLKPESTTQTNNSNELQNEDIEIMKQRSANNNTFLCIKIPEIQLLVSYKGNKEKNIKDLTDVSLLFPLFEVHDKTWTWLDLINALKSHVKKALVSQALKHKLIKVPIKPVNKLINRGKRSQSNQQLTNLEMDEHEKMTILKLFGAKLIEKKSITPPMALPSPPTNKLDKKQQHVITDESMSLLSNGSSPIKQLMMTATANNSKSVDDDSELVDRKNRKLQKSNSTLSFNFKKRFLKFKSEKSASNLK